MVEWLCPPSMRLALEGVYAFAAEFERRLVDARTIVYEPSLELNRPVTTWIADGLIIDINVRLETGRDALVAPAFTTASAWTGDPIAATIGVVCRVLRPSFQEQLRGRMNVKVVPMEGFAVFRKVAIAVVTTRGTLHHQLPRRDRRRAWWRPQKVAVPSTRTESFDLHDPIDRRRALIALRRHFAC